MFSWLMAHNFGFILIMAVLCGIAKIITKIFEK